MPLKNRNLIAAVSLALVAVMVSYAYWTLFYVPIRKDIAKARESVRTLDQQLQTARARAQQLNKIQEEMAGLQVEVVELEKQLPRGRELPALLRTLTRRAETCGLTLFSLAPGRPVPKGAYDEIPYAMSLSSSFHGLARFLTSMGKGDRLFAARNLTLSGSGSRTDPAKTVTASLTLVAFQYHE